MWGKDKLVFMVPQEVSGSEIFLCPATNRSLRACSADVAQYHGAWWVSDGFKDAFSYCASLKPSNFSYFVGSKNRKLQLHCSTRISPAAYFI